MHACIPIHKINIKVHLPIWKNLKKEKLGITFFSKIIKNNFLKYFILKFSQVLSDIIHFT